MKTSKLLTASAVATALFPLAALAAIDDQGMQYVSAAEGLHGSMRVDILKKVDKETSKETTGGGNNSLRLWISGSGDVGNGWATTYYWEVRDGNRDADGNGENDAGIIGTEAWTVGLRGPMGSFDFGRSAMVAPRMVPGGSLDTVVGGNAASFACDVCDNTHRFESVAVNGLQLGFSAVTNSKEIGDEDDLVDEYSMALKYSNPVGFQIGVGYELDLIHDVRYPNQPAYADYDDRSGWRAGVRYGRDNWLLAYEYRTYDGFNEFGNLNVTTAATSYTYLNRDLQFLRSDGTEYLKYGTVTIAPGGWYDESTVEAITALPLTFDPISDAILNTHITTTMAAALNPANSVRPVNSVTSVDFYNKLKYEVQRAGVQVKFSRFTTSLGYSIATQKLDLPGAIDIDQTALAADVAFHLGLNSLIAVGWKRVKTETWDRGIAIADRYLRPFLANATRIGSKQEATETTTQLYYRVDF